MAALSRASVPPRAKPAAENSGGDQRGGPVDGLGGHQSSGDARAHRPESADADAEQDPGRCYHGHAGGRRCQDVGGGTEQRESDQDLTPVEPSRGDGDQGSSDRSHQAGYDDDQADGGFSDAPSTWL